MTSTIRMPSPDLLARLFSIGAVVCLGLMTACPARGQLATVANYNFANTSLASTENGPESTASAISTGAGLSGHTVFMPAGGSDYAYGASSVNLQTSEALAAADSDYISFQVTPSAGETLTYGVSFDFQADLLVDNGSSSSTFDGYVEAFSSADNYASPIFTGSSGAVGAFQSNNETGIGGTFSLQAETAPITFVLYFYDNAATSSVEVGLTNISLIATAAPIPEASPCADVILAGSGLVLLAKCRRSKALGEKKDLLPGERRFSINS